MSIYVFGRKLGGAESNRGPPGAGFLIIKDKQYDLQNKRLCNVGSAHHSNDAVNLTTLQNVLASELKNIQHSLSQLLKDLKVLEYSIDIHIEEIDKKCLELSSDISKLKERMSILPQL